jgi:hypothetical protein
MLITIAFSIGTGQCRSQLMYKQLLPSSERLNFVSCKLAPECLLLAQKQQLPKDIIYKI